MKRSIHSILLGGLFLLPSTGCDTQETLTVRIPYKLGAGMTCEEAKVTTLRASLGSNRSQQFESSCDDSGELVLNNVREGRWALVVEGIDADGGISLSSEAANPNLVLDFTEGDRETPMVTLTSVPAKVQLRWDLGFGDCTSFELKGFNVQAWDESNARLLMSGMIDCDAPMNDQLYRTLKDPDGRIIASHLHALTIQPISTDGQNYGDPVRIDLEKRPGKDAIVRASLKCNADARSCTLEDVS